MSSKSHSAFGICSRNVRGFASIFRVNPSVIRCEMVLVALNSSDGVQYAVAKTRSPSSSFSSSGHSSLSFASSSSPPSPGRSGSRATRGWTLATRRAESHSKPGGPRDFGTSARVVLALPSLRESHPYTPNSSRDTGTTSLPGFPSRFPDYARAAMCT